MKLANYLTNKKNSMISASLIVIILLGSVPIINIKIMGVVPTFYRVCIPVFTLYFLYKNFHFIGESIRKNKLTFYKISSLFAVFWLIYGGIQILVCPYVDLKTGLQELVNILLGFFSVLCIIQCVLMDGGMRAIINSARAVIAAITVIGIFEMITCIHLGTSQFCSDTYLDVYMETYGFLPADGKVSAMATGIFYNVNDFSAWLGVFSVLFFPRKQYKLWIKVLFFSELSAIVLIALVNDAWICLVAMCVGGIAYLIFIRAKLLVCLVTFLWIGAMKLFSVQIFFHAVGYIYWILFPNKKLPRPIENLIRDGTSQVAEAVEGQIAGMKTGRGSLSLRFNTYGTAIKDTFSSSFGLGFGPGSFSNYFGALNSSNVLLNPHSLWIEILFQYGILVLIGFLAVLVYAFLLLLKCWKYTQSATYAMILAMDIILVLISFAPSSFIGYSYLWVPIGLTLGVVMKERLNLMI